MSLNCVGPLVHIMYRSHVQTGDGLCPLIKNLCAINPLQVFQQFDAAPGGALNVIRNDA